MDRVVPLTRSARRERRRPEPLWREVVGEELRRARLGRRERIVDVAARAGVSPQYLSELERGRKDASSEMLSSVAGALDLSLLDLTHRAGRRLSLQASVPVSATRATTTSGPVLLAA